MNTKTRDPLAVLRAAAMRDDGLNRQEQREAIAQVEALITWMPIESAPKDSRVVLLCDARGNRWCDCSPGLPENGCGFPAIAWRELPPPVTTGQNSENNS